MTKHHGIKVGDLVKFKHHIFDEHMPVWLVIEAWYSLAKPGYLNVTNAETDRRSQCIKVHGINAMNGRPKTQRASNFVIISRACN